MFLFVPWVSCWDNHKKISKPRDLFQFSIQLRHPRVQRHRRGDAARAPLGSAGGGGCGGLRAVAELTLLGWWSHGHSSKKLGVGYDMTWYLAHVHTAKLYNSFNEISLSHSLYLSIFMVMGPTLQGGQIHV